MAKSDCAGVIPEECGNHFDRIHRTLDRVDTALRGDGLKEPGLVARVMAIEKRQCQSHEGGSNATKDGPDDETRWPLSKKIAVGVTIYVLSNLTTGVIVWLCFIFHEHPIAP